MAKKIRRTSDRPEKPSAPTDDAHPRCGIGICDPQRTHEEVETSPYSEILGVRDLVNLKGCGLFLSAWVDLVDVGNVSGSVRLEIDGRAVVDLPYGTASGLGSPNPFGVKTHQVGWTIGWPFPLAYKRELRLSVVAQSGIYGITADVVHASSG